MCNLVDESWPRVGPGSSAPLQEQRQLLRTGITGFPTSRLQNPPPVFTLTRILDQNQWVTASEHKIGQNVPVKHHGLPSANDQKLQAKFGEMLYLENFLDSTKKTAFKLKSKVREYSRILTPNCFFNALHNLNPKLFIQCPPQSEVF